MKLLEAMEGRACPSRTPRNIRKDCSLKTVDIGHGRANSAAQTRYARPCIRGVRRHLLPDAGDLHRTSRSIGAPAELRRGSCCWSHRRRVGGSREGSNRRRTRFRRSLPGTIWSCVPGAVGSHQPDSCREIWCIATTSGVPQSRWALAFVRAGCHGDPRLRRPNGAQQFDGEYDAYCSRTSRLIPGLY